MCDAIRAVLIEPQSEPQPILLDPPWQTALQVALRWTGDIFGFGDNNISMLGVNSGTDEARHPNVLFTILPETTPRSRWTTFYGPVVVVQTREVFDDEGSSVPVSISDKNLSCVLCKFSLSGKFRVEA